MSYCSKTKPLKHEFYFIYFIAETIKISHKFKYCFSQVKWVFFEIKTPQQPKHMQYFTHVIAVLQWCLPKSHARLRAKRTYRTKRFLQQQGRVLKTEKNLFSLFKSYRRMFCVIFIKKKGRKKKLLPLHLLRKHASSRSSLCEPCKWCFAELEAEMYSGNYF